MCGISGYLIKGSSVKAANIIKINDAIKHRGPDDEGFVLLQDKQFKSYSGNDSVPAIKDTYPRLEESLNTTLSLGFRRLSILDLSEKGHQPMINNNVCITFNGEIYNFKVLRKVLQEAGYNFDTATDTEVVLKAYQHWGIGMVERLNGMFAIAIVDLALGKTYLIRDRLGIKPLFYFQDETHITWCSEMKGILKADWVQAKMNMDGLILNYQFKSSVAPSTCFQDIYALPPAHILSVDMAKLQIDIKQYWEIPTGISQNQMSQDDVVARLTEKLSHITALQMQADVPLISMMSGGIDSTLVTALAHEQDPTISCYTLSIDGSGNGADELPQAQDMAKRLGIKQYVQHITEQDIVDNAINHLSHFEEPYNSLDVIFNAAHYLQQNGFKVILSGNGADEVFGGYGYNLNLLKWKKLRRYSFMASLLPNGDPKFRRLKYYLSLKNIGQYFLSTTGGLRDRDIASLIKQTNLNQIQALTKPFIAKEHFTSDYEGLFYYDLKYSVGAHHVYHDDMCAMRYSVEMRYPFLDHELIEMVAALPLSLRYNGKINKPLLRHVATNYIQDSNLKMGKKGFNLPQDVALEHNKDLQQFVKEHIDFLKTTGIFESSAIDNVINEAKQKQYYQYVWQLVSTAVWMKTYL